MLLSEDLLKKMCLNAHSFLANYIRVLRNFSHYLKVSFILYLYSLFEHLTTWKTNILQDFVQSAFLNRLT